MNRPPWPPEVVAAYERGSVVSWSPTRECWMVDGKPLEAPPVAPLRAVRPLRELPARCPRCGSASIVPATDEDGDPDDHCVACSHRVGAMTPEQAEALKAEVDAREIGPGGTRRTRRPHMVSGVKL